MQPEGSIITSFFDDDEPKTVFDFIKAEKIPQKFLHTPSSLKAFFHCQAPDTGLQEGYYSLQGKFIIKHQDGAFKSPYIGLDLSNSRFKVLSSTECDGKFGFSLTRNGNTFNFLSKEDQTVNDWVDVLKGICVLPNFHEEYKALKMIGKGSFAKVYLVESKTTGKSFAVKAFTKESIILSSKNNAKPSIINEIEIMRSIDHDHTIKLYEVYETEKSIYLVLDLILGKSLQDALKKTSFKQESSDIRIFNMIRSILDALAYLASKRVMHRDLKPDNILIDKNDDKIKIVDFGLATYIDLPEYIFKKCGTPGYIAPEVFKFDQKNKTTAYDDRCDVFSAGCIFYYLLFGTPFFEGTDVSGILNSNRKVSSNPEALNKIKQEKSNPKSKISKEGLDLLLQLLEMDPKRRISAAQALDHPYFTPMPLGMHKASNSNGFFVEALSKYNQNRPSSPSIKSPVKELSDSTKPLYPMASGTLPERTSPRNVAGNRFTEKDSLYLDMGRPELNGKIDTLTSGSMNNSLLLQNRLDNTGSTPGSVSAFAKNKVIQDQRRRPSKNFKAGIGSQSILKAAIFRNMQKNNEISPGEETKPMRRGSIEVNLQSNGYDRRYSHFLSDKQPGERNRNFTTESRFQSNNEEGDDPSPDNLNKLPQMPHKRFQPFGQKNL